MRLLVGLALIAATPAVAAGPAPGPDNPGPVADGPVSVRADCNGERKPTPISSGRGGVWRLTDPPPANMMLTVMRKIDGCPVPVIVRYGVDRRPQEAVPSGAGTTWR